MTFDTQTIGLLLFYIAGALIMGLVGITYLVYKK